MKLFVPRIAAVSVAALCRCNRSRAVSKPTFVASLVLFCAIGLLAPARAGAVTIAWSPVGNPGNAGELSGEGAGGFGSTAILGAVGYNYRMGTYDVTAGQYVEFLNAKDSSGLNPLGLYRSSMSNGTFGGISFSAGNANGSKYGVKAGRGNHPVNYLTGYAAYRFANWLNNGQGSGDTESGAYTLLGGTPTPSNALSIPRNAGATVFLPTEDEWYKAAYYNPGSSSYFHYPTSSNTQPTWTGPTAVPNSANYGRVVGNLTDVGAYSGTTSPYGAFDMGGNVYQWIEGDNLGPYWRLRGGSWIDDSIYLESKNHSNAFDPTDGLEQIGFRVASIPEPSTGVLAVMAGGLMWWWRRRSSREKGTSWFSSKSTMSPGMSPFSSQKCCIGNQQQRRLPRRTKPVALVLVALLWTAATSPSLAVTYTTLDDPLGTNDGSFPNGIDGNKIVGLYVDSSGIHGYLYNGTTFTTLANPPGTNGWVPRGVSGGNIVGLYNDASFGSHGVLYNGATFTTLDHPLATNGTRAFGIDGNRIVGMYIDSSGQHGFLYNGTTYTTIDDPLVGAFGTNAIGISGNNIVGKYNDASGTHGFLYNGTTYTTLDFPGGSTTVAQGIDGNNIVGSYDNATGQHGFLYDGTIYTTLDYPLATAGATSARGIDGNNIVGSYSYASSSHGFLANVPEPSTAVLAAMACGLMWWWRKRFK